MELALMKLLGSRAFWLVLLASAALVSGKLYVDGRYDAGLEAGRLECRSEAIQAQLDESERLRQDAELRAERESGRADRAYETAAQRTVEVRTVRETAQAQANADEVCLTEEVTDAIRAIR